MKERLSRKLYQQRTPDGRESVTPIAPDAVLVTIAEYRPVYVNGDVTKPGEQTFRPGMTVRQAVALAGGYEITPADLRGALERQRTEVRAGDVVIVHTGWGSLWNVDNAAFGATAPGIGLEAAQYLVDREVVLVGSDTWATEVVPNPNPDLAFVVHNELITKNGILNHENLDFNELIKDRVSEFVYVFAPLRIKGATGSPGRPIAIV